MMPYLAPEAAMPISSCAPRLAAMNARLVIQTGIDRPESEEVAAGGDLLAQHPTDAEDKGEIQGENDVVYGSELQSIAGEK
jgi:hypothetical protein